jgi:hypothetical protein
LDPTNILSVLTNLIKQRDYLFFGIPSIGIFIAESISEGVIPFMPVGTSAIVAGVLGMILNKSAVQFALDNKKKRFTLQASKNYVEYLDELLLNQQMLVSHRNVIEAIKMSLESTIAMYEKKIMTYDEFKIKFNSLKDIDFDF